MGGGGGGGGGECQRIKVLRSRVYPLGQLPTIKIYIHVDPLLVMLRISLRSTSDFQGFKKATPKSES